MTGLPPKRLLPARSDLAAEHLRGRVEAARFAEGRRRRVAQPALSIRREPRDGAGQETQALFGEGFTVYEETGGWAWGQAEFDGYVGYVRAEGLAEPKDAPTHRVAALRTYRYPKPDLKAPPLGLVSMNAKVAPGEPSEDGKFVSDGEGGWVVAAHLVPLAEGGEDPAAVAERFLGTPYFWGGRESLGLDCSGLIQNAYEACGVCVPRDADLQEAFFSRADHGEIVWERENAEARFTAAALRRGDLVYWRGHTGVMLDGQRLLHANATHMAVSVDDLRDVAAHLERDEDLPVTRIVRPTPISALRIG
ncbi:C40 family peptidase [Parvularcula oceani]|uniref:C40 family peptidase n=1 Tax=Parvularcula oceani TaxID=1247963 RepID=UPI0004E259BB|nr:NlpC/P60 family protein [Parvularcula oceani]